jgi:hypothetical protein
VGSNTSALLARLFQVLALIGPATLPIATVASRRVHSFLRDLQDAPPLQARQ